MCGVFSLLWSKWQHIAVTLPCIKKSNSQCSHCDMCHNDYIIIFHSHSFAKIYVFFPYFMGCVGLLNQPMCSMSIENCQVLKVGLSWSTLFINIPYTILYRQSSCSACSCVQTNLDYFVESKQCFLCLLPCLHYQNNYCFDINTETQAMYWHQY